MKAHCDNASKVANFLEKHKSVKKVIYPELQSGSSKILADKHLQGGYGGLVGFELSGGLKAGKKFIDALELFYHVANIGDTRSLAIHPATTTHSQLSAEEQFKTGVSEDYVRLSVGIEHIDDIIIDLTKAIEKSQT
jgi:O-acetylhomoserine (thiol)-lyase